MSRPPPSVLTEDRLRDMERRGSEWNDPHQEATRLRNERATLIAEVRRLRAGVAWLAQTVHQAHHGEHAAGCPADVGPYEVRRPRMSGAPCTCSASGTWKDCRRGTCTSVRHVLGDGDVTKEGT